MLLRYNLPSVLFGAMALVCVLTDHAGFAIAFLTASLLIFMVPK